MKKLYSLIILALFANMAFAQVNDNCAGAVNLCVTNTSMGPFHLEGASDDGTFVGCSGAVVNKGVWFTFTAYNGGSSTLNVTNQSTGVRLSGEIYSGTCGALVAEPGTCKSSIATGAGLSINFNAVSGTTYYALISIQSPISPAQAIISISINNIAADAIIGNPTALLTSSPNFVCEQDSFVTLTNQTIEHGAITSYSFDMGAGFQPTALCSKNVGGCLNYDTIVNAVQLAAGADSVKLILNADNGCTSIPSNQSFVWVKIHKSSAVAANITSGPLLLCTGDSTTLTGGAGYGLTYQWLKNNVVIASATKRSYVAKAAGSYRVLVSNGCYSDTSAPAVVVITPFASAKVNAAGPTTFCQGLSVQLNTRGSIGTSFQWQKNGVDIPGETDTIYSAVASGSYRCVVSNYCKTDTSAKIAVTVKPNVTVNVSNGGPLTFCNGGNVKLTADTGSLYTYQWYLNYAPVSGATLRSITATLSGNYKAFITNACNTDSSAAVTVNALPLPADTIHSSRNPIMCKGDIDTLTASPGASYVWNTGQTTDTLIVRHTGVFRVTVTGINGCTRVSQLMTVHENAGPVANATAVGPTTVCGGTIVKLKADTLFGNQYQWLLNTLPIASATVDTFAASQSGSYAVKVTNNCGTATSSPIAINVIPFAADTIVSSGPTKFCQGGNVVLTASPGATYKWSTGATTRNITVSTNGIYKVTVSNGTCAKPSVSDTVRVKPLTPAINLVASGPLAFCNGSVTLKNKNGLDYQFSWLKDGAVIPGETDTSLFINTTGSYKVVINNGCKSDTSKPYDVISDTTAHPVIQLSGPSEFCLGDSVTLSTTMPYASYAWSNGATTPTVTINSSATVNVTVTNGGGCTGISADQVIIVNNPPSADINLPTDTTTICYGANVILSALGVDPGFAVLWSNGSTLIDNTVSQAGTYSCVVTSDKGCSNASRAVTVLVRAKINPYVTIFGDTALCNGPKLILSVFTVPYKSYIWNDPLATTTKSLQVTATGTYIVTVTDINGCTDMSTPIKVTKKPNVTVPLNANGSLIFCQGDTLKINAPKGYTTYKWPDLSTKDTMVVTGPYTNLVVTVTDASGCQYYSIPTTIIVNPAPPVPTITRIGLLLTSSSSTGNQWLNYRTPITGATQQDYLVKHGGLYRVRVTNGYGCNAFSDTIRIVIAGINDHEELGQVQVYPNPSSEDTYIKYDVVKEEEVTIEIFNTIGEKAYTVVNNEKLLAGSHSYVIRKSDLPTAGIYYIKISSGESSVIQKIIRIQ